MVVNIALMSKFFDRAISIFLFLSFGTVPVLAQDSTTYYPNSRILELMSSPSEAAGQEIDEIVVVNMEQAPDSILIGTLQLAREYYLFLQEDNKKSVLYGERLIRLAHKMKRYKRLGEHYGRLIHSFWRLSDFEKHHKYALRTEYYGKKYQDTLSWIEGVNQLSQFYSHIRVWDQALIYNQKAIELSREGSSFDRKAMLKIYRSEYYHSMGDSSLAISTALEALSFCKRNYDSVFVYAGIANLYLEANDIAKGSEYIELGKKTMRGQSSVKSLENYFYYLQGVSAFKSREYEDALSWLIKSEEELKIVSDFEALEDVYEMLYEIAKLQKDDRQAFQYLELKKQVSDFLALEDNRILAAKAYYDDVILAKELENASVKNKYGNLKKTATAEKEARYFSYWIIVALLAILVAFTLVVRKYIKRQRVRRAEAQQRFEEKMELKNKELASANLWKTDRSNSIKEAEDKLSKISKKISRNDNADGQALSDELYRIQHLLESNDKLEWGDFRYYFEQLNEGYFERVRERHPNISNYDEKMIAYTKIGLDSKQISRLLNITQDSVHKQRYRLRKKMDLAKDTNLKRYLEEGFK